MKKKNLHQAFFYCCFSLFLSNFVFGQVNSKKKSETTPFTLRIFLSDAEKADTLVLFTKTIPDLFPAKELKSTMGKDSSFTFQIPSNVHYGFFRIGKIIPKEKWIVNTNDSFNWVFLTKEFYWERGDHLIAKIGNIAQYEFKNSKDVSQYYLISFFGKSGINYSLQETICKSLDKIKNTPVKIFNESYDINDPMYNSRHFALQLIEKNKRKLTESFYYVLKSNYLFKWDPFIDVSDYFDENIVDTDKVKFRKRFAHQQFQRMNPNEIPVKYRLRSFDYITYLTNEVKTEIYLQSREKNKPFKISSYFNPNPDSVYYKIRNRYTGELRDVLIANFLSFDHRFNNPKTIVADATNIVHTKESKNIVSVFTNTIQPDKAEFNKIKIIDSVGNFHTLSDYEGKVVFIDFYFLNCGGCQSFYQNTLSKVERKFSGNKNIIFLSISVDANKNNWYEGINSGKYVDKENAILLYTNGSQTLHPIVKAFGAKSFPTAIILDKNGQIVKSNTPDLYDEQSLTNNINTILNK